jgi:hypothetical protein
MTARAGVGYNEVDQSIIDRASPSGRQCFLLRTKKGKLGVANLVRTWTQFVQDHGNPYLDNDDALIVKQTLTRGTPCYIGRVVHASNPDDITTITAVKSSRVVQDRTTVASPAVLLSSDGPFVLDAGDNIHITVNGSTASDITLSASAAKAESAVVSAPSAWNFTGGKVLNVKFGKNADAGPTQFISFVNGDFSDPANATPTEVMNKLNASLVGGHAELFTSGSDTGVRLVDDIKGSNSGVLVSGGTANAILAYPTSQQSASGTQNVANIAKTTAAELAAKVTAAAISGLSATTVGAKFKLVTIATGVSATLKLESPSTIGTKIGMTVNITVTGSNSTSATNTLKFQGKSEGTWADGIQYSVADNTTIVGTFDVSIPVQPGVTKAELFTQLNMDSSSENYVVSILNAKSKVLDVVNQNSAKVAPYNNPQVGTYVLAGGDDGLASLNGGDWYGGPNSKLGVFSFANAKDSMDLHIPGLTDRAAIQAIGNKCKADGNRVFYPSFPNPTDPDDCVDFINAQNAYAGQGTAFDNNYMAFYFDRPKEKDFTNADKFIQGSGHLAAVLGYNDTGNGKLTTGFGTWFAPAGEKRGKIGSLGLEVNLGDDSRQSIREYLEDNQINIFADFGSGPMVWDQRTTYRANSAFKDLNVRRLLIQIRRDTIVLVRSELWDPNDPTMWRAVYRKLEPYFSDLRQRRALYEYDIQCDQNANSVEDAIINNPNDIDEGEFKCNMYLKPTRAARRILLSTIVTSTAAKFTEELLAA